MKFYLGVILFLAGVRLLWASTLPQDFIDYVFETDVVENFARDRMYLDTWEWLNSSVWLGLKEEFSSGLKGAIGVVFFIWGLALIKRDFLREVLPGIEARPD